MCVNTGLCILTPRMALCNSHHNQDTELACHHQAPSSYRRIATPVLWPLPCPCLLVSPDLVILRTLYKWNPVVCDHLRSAPFARHNSLEVHPGCVYRWFTTFYYGTVFHGVQVAVFLTFHRRAFGCSQFGAITKKDAMNTHV